MAKGAKVLRFFGLAMHASPGMRRGSRGDDGVVMVGRFSQVAGGGMLIFFVVVSGALVCMFGRMNVVWNRDFAK